MFCSISTKVQEEEARMIHLPCPWRPWRPWHHCHRGPEQPPCLNCQSPPPKPSPLCGHRPSCNSWCARAARGTSRFPWSLATQPLHFPLWPQWATGIWTPSHRPPLARTWCWHRTRQPEPPCRTMAWWRSARRRRPSSLWTAASWGMSGTPAGTPWAAAHSIAWGDEALGARRSSGSMKARSRSPSPVSNTGHLSPWGTQLWLYLKVQLLLLEALETKPASDSMSWVAHGALAAGREIGIASPEWIPLHKKRG